jgi:hypothetical protein
VEHGGADQRRADDEKESGERAAEGFQDRLRG